LSRKRALSEVRPPIRRGPSRKPRARFLVYCEGHVTETEYFKYVRSALRDTLLTIEIAKENGDPWYLVNEAVGAIARARVDAKRERDDNLLFDQVWCIVDVDRHERLHDARALAAAQGIRLAVSNPCFELWALLHFEDQTAFLTSSDAAVRLRVCFPGYEKSLDCTRLLGRYAAAKGRAVHLNSMHVLGGQDRGSNPSSDVWMVGDALRTAADAFGGPIKWSL